MENQNNNTELQHSEYQKELSSLEIYNKGVAKCLGENIYLLGFTGEPATVLSMSNKLVEIFGDFDIELLRQVFLEYQSGERDIAYNFNISHISKALIDNGLETLKMAKSREFRDEFYKK